jgi:hypothetical protein
MRVSLMGGYVFSFSRTSPAGARQMIIKVTGRRQRVFSPAVMYRDRARGIVAPALQRVRPGCEASGLRPQQSYTRVLQH